MYLKFETNNNKGYKIDGIWDSAVYVGESIMGQLLIFYYLIL